jgi:hypothetical protein
MGQSLPSSTSEENKSMSTYHSIKERNQMNKQNNNLNNTKLKEGW